MTTYGLDSATAELSRVLQALEAGTFGRDGFSETSHVDLKEEAGRRRGPEILPPQTHNEAAARSLAVETACMSNSEGGGYLVVGAEDDGRLIGTELDGDWLRRRIYDITERRLTVGVLPQQIRGVRLLVLNCPEAVEPIRVDGKIRWRVADSCVEIDAATWHQRRLWRIGFDWSAQSSGLHPEHARATALERSRSYLRDSAEEHAAELADLGDLDLLNRLDVLTSEGLLTNAGAVAFVGRKAPAVDYIRREMAGGDSVNRIRAGDRGLVEELYDIEQAIRAANPIRHVAIGLVSGQVRQLPVRAVRESIVNGAVHRDWSTLEPTLIEHEAGTLTVTSPGGFIGGVTPDNIITHPSQPRNRALAELFAALRVAEREGIGVDRMVLDMLRVGHAPPVIEELSGPRIRATLLGDLVDEGWMRFLSELQPEVHRRNLNSLLLMRHLVEHWWLDERISAPILQRPPLVARAAIGELEAATVGGAILVERVTGTPADSPTAWHLTTAAATLLAEGDDAVGYRRHPPSRAQVATEWAKARGRVSTTELASIVGAHATNVGGVLKGLESDGVLVPGREPRRGPGFFYKPAELDRSADASASS